MLAAGLLDAVLDVVDHAYAGVDDPSRWPTTLEALAKLLDARAAGLRIETVAAGVEQTWVGLEPAFDRAYVEHYWQDDPWAIRLWTARVGEFGHGDALCPRAVVEKSAFHNELALGSGLDDLAGGILERGNGRVVSLGLMKGAGAKRFDATTDAIAKRVVPHIARALALGDRVARGAAVAPAASLRDAGLYAALTARLRSRYALTPTEARVAIGIGGGIAPKTIASDLGASWHTVRAHLRQIFAKTEQRSQSALARLVTLLEAELTREAALTKR